VRDARNQAEQLGDLYQHACEAARKGRALVQTPPFVRDLILSKTLAPSLATFGVAGTRLIDPSCGTGHFLIDAFWLLWAAWLGLPGAERGRLLGLARGPDGPPEKAAVAQIVLAQVVGVDLDPACVSLARYRLTLAAWEACGQECTTFRVHVFEGDALLHGRPRPGDDARFGPWPYDAEAVREALTPGRYTAVVANPPYIRCDDAALRDAYRERYPTASGQFSLAVPFTELCWGLAVKASDVGGGW
jgi:SAM-dependent methyltransferase